jgi:putative Mg2+ transporter-C (MgtC) family protein
MTIYPEDILRILVSLALGGMIGAEREMRGKAAGLRTLMFISAGSTLFTIFSTRLAQTSGSDPTRITAQIVTGIGFLGAGVILREGGEIHGLTTAAMIWLTAAVGVGVGGGQYLFSTLVTVLTLLALLFFPFLERTMDRINQVRTYQVVAPASQEKFEALCEQFRRHHLRVGAVQRKRRGSEMVCTWTVTGRQENHNAIFNELFEDSQITEFEV